MLTISAGSTVLIGIDMIARGWRVPLHLAVVRLGDQWESSQHFAFYDWVELIGLEPDDADRHTAPPDMSEFLPQVGRGVETRLEDGSIVESGKRTPRS